MLVVCIALSACRPGELVPIADAPPATQTTPASETPHATSTLTPRPTMTATATVVPTDTPTPTETPTLAPEVYKIVPAYTQTVAATIYGCAVNFDIVIDETLTTRKVNPVMQWGFTQDFVDDKGHSPAESNAIAAYYGFWYAWKNNDGDQREARRNVSFESFVKLVSQGEAVVLLPLDDVRDPSRYDPTVTLVNVRDFRRIVLVDKNQNTLFRDMGMGLDIMGDAVGLHLRENGDWEIWTHVTERKSNARIAKLNDIAVAMAIGYDYLSAQSFRDPLTYQPEVYDNLNALFMYQIEYQSEP